jgi:hypothetical protein
MASISSGSTSGLTILSGNLPQENYVDVSRHRQYYQLQD